MNYKIYLSNIKFKLRRKYNYYISKIELYFKMNKNELINQIKTELKKIGYEINSYKILSVDWSILLIKIDSNKDNLICKITLNNNQLHSLEKNFEFLNLFSDKTDLIPQPVLKVKYKQQIIFVEKLLEGTNGFDIFLYKNCDIDDLVYKGYEKLNYLKRNVLSKYQMVPISNNDIFKNYENILSKAFEKIPKFLYAYKLIKSTSNKYLKTGLCFGDYWIGNILYANDLKISGIIDFDKLSFNLHQNYDELHLYITTYALSKGISNGQEIINRLNESKINKEDLFFYWISFIINNIKSDENILKNRRWINKNIKKVSKYILKNYKGESYNEDNKDYIISNVYNDSI